MSEDKGEKKLNSPKVSRRDFLKNTGILAAGSALGATLLAGCANNSPQKDEPSLTWDHEAEVVILGTGAGGLCAAISAARAGADVLIIEKSNENDMGGNTRVSGNMWTVPLDVTEGLKYYLAASERKSDEEYLTALCKSANVLNDEYLSTMTNMEVTKLAIFSPEFKALPGGSVIQAFQNKATGNGQLWDSLYATALGYKNIRFFFETPGLRLITNAGGDVIGIGASQNGKEVKIKAKKGVVLATGGYEFNRLMIENSYPGWPVYSRGTPYNTGDGILMAQKAGAGLWHMNASDSGSGAALCPGLNFGHGAYDSDLVPANMSLNSPSAARNRFFFVDKHGKRFMPEDRPDGHGYGRREYLFFYDGVACEWPRLPYWNIFDETEAKKGPVCSGKAQNRLFTWFTAHSGYTWSNDNSAEVAKGWIFKGDTIEDLAAKLDIEPGVLAETLATYNGYASTGVDAEFGRKGDTLVAMEGPFYAIAVYPNQYNTQGGPKRNTKAQTLDAFDKPIPRLYNVGECGAGYGWVYNGGWNNAEAMVTGKWAGEHVVTLSAWDA